MSSEIIKLEVEPASEAQVYFLNSTKRSICFNSGWGAGKTFIACFKALLLLCQFPKSRCVIGRQQFSDLAKTTRETFYQVCPPSLYDEKQGGARADGRGYLKLINGSEVFFMHFSDIDVKSIKSLEINFMLLDQCEEIPESIYLALDARLGRKSDAIVPEYLLAENPNWPLNEHTKKPQVPSYAFLLINPPDEGELHYLIQRFHPKSEEFRQKYQAVNDYVWSSSRSNKALPKETLDTMLSRDPKWVARYVDGEIGQGEGSVHFIEDHSIVSIEDFPHGFLELLLKKGSLSRILDHGASAPTCCLWAISYRGFHYIYREYYVPGEIITYHRNEINNLSLNEYYSQNLADPAIFKKTSEKFGGFWTVADEYLDSSLDSAPIAWLPADNNEMATRNRINELLKFDPKLINPLNGSQGSPRLFFIKRSKTYPNGCYHVIRETKGQKYELLDTINGRSIYSDDRDKNIADHSYDCLRYYCASHLLSKTDPVRKPSANSFMGMVNRLKALKKAEYFQEFPLN